MNTTLENKLNAPNQSESTALAVVQDQPYSLQPRSFDEAWNLATMIAKTDMAPKDYQGKPERCMVAIQWGDEVGLKPLQSVQNIAVINGRPSLWGDSMLAIVRASPLCKYFIEKWEGSGDSLKAICRTHRVGEPEEQMREFSMTDAKTAGLLNKDTYKQYGKRMIQMRARGWLIRDVYTDLIRGLHMAEEAMDMPAPTEKFMGAADVVGTPPPPPPPTEWPADLFAARLPEWHKAIKDKKATADAIVAKARTKYPLTPEQEQSIRTPPKPDATDAAPKVTFANVADAIAAAVKDKNGDALADAGTLIGEVADPEQRQELTAKYEAALAEI
ncbi:MAG TPA: hypothetical protein VLJ58_21660 [Ramlibacter sp.]|nr:hypothetical protein [Ramlibacter sp.]